MSYPIMMDSDISITNICERDIMILGISLFHSATGPFRLRSLAAPSDPGWHGLLAAPFTTVLRSSSVAATDRTPRLGLPAQTATALLSLPPCLYFSLTPLQWLSLPSSCYLSKALFTPFSPSFRNTRQDNQYSCLCSAVLAPGIPVQRHGRDSMIFLG